jgi:hypothetical protein
LNYPISTLEDVASHYNEEVNKRNDKDSKKLSKKKLESEGMKKKNYVVSEKSELLLLYILIIYSNFTFHFYRYK